MKISRFLRSFLQCHNTPPAAAPGGTGTNEAGGGGSFVDQVLSALPGGELLSGGEGEGPGATDGDGHAGALPGNDNSAGGGDDDRPDAWIDRLPADVQSEVRTRMARLEGERDGILRVVPKPGEGQQPAGKPAAAAKAPAVNPLARLSTHDEIDAVETRSEELRDWAVANWEGGTMKGPDGEDFEITAEQARKMYLEHDKILRKHIPGRRAELEGAATRAQKQEAVAREAQQIYPWLAMKDSPEFKTFQMFKQAFPELLQKFDDAPMFVADMVSGFLARKAKGKSASASAAAAGAGAGTEAGDEGGELVQVTNPIPPKPNGGSGPDVRRPAVVPKGGNAGGGRNGGGNYEASLEKLAAGGGTKAGLVEFLQQLYPEGQG